MAIEFAENPFAVKEKLTMFQKKKVLTYVGVDAKGRTVFCDKNDRLWKEYNRTLWTVKNNYFDEELDVPIDPAIVVTYSQEKVA